MEKKDFTGIVPPQYTGKAIEAAATTTLLNKNEALHFYKVAKERLLNVNNWHQIAGMMSARFQVVDASGNEVMRLCKKGDYLKIDIPGPGSTEGEGYDWVSIEELKEVDDALMQSVAFRVRPSENPLGKKNETAHFYDEASTSNFIVTREDTKVSACVIDRNIKPNAAASSLTDKIRDTSVGISALSFFSKIQWQLLANGIVSPPKK